jgi:hypothetical protein
MQMFFYARNDKNHRPSRRIIASLILLLTCLWVFVATIDGPSIRFGSKSAYDVYKTAKVADGGHSAQPWPLWIGGSPKNFPTIHTSFLLFDFKQNLRRWPNVAGDISRSPPFFLAA